MGIIELGKELNLEVKPHWSEKHVYYLDVSDLQVYWYDKNDGKYSHGWQVSDERGNSLYTGLNNKEVKELINTQRRCIK